MDSMDVIDEMDKITALFCLMVGVHLNYFT